MLEHGEDGGDGPLGCRDVMGAVCVADGDVRANGGWDPLCARHHRQHEANAAEMRPNAQGARGIGIGDPDIDLDVVIQIIRQRNQLDSRGHDAQKICVQFCWVSNTEHTGDLRLCYTVGGWCQ
jgi:hypothetical protein